MNTVQETRLIKAGQKRIAITIRQLGLTAML